MESYGENIILYFCNRYNIPTAIAEMKSVCTFMTIVFMYYTNNDTSSTMTRLAQEFKSYHISMNNSKQKDADILFNNSDKSSDLFMIFSYIFKRLDYINEFSSRSLQKITLRMPMESFMSDFTIKLAFICNFWIAFRDYMYIVLFTIFHPAFDTALSEELVRIFSIEPREHVMESFTNLQRDLDGRFVLDLSNRFFTGTKYKNLDDPKVLVKFFEYVIKFERLAENTSLEKVLSEMKNCVNKMTDEPGSISKMKNSMSGSVSSLFETNKIAPSPLSKPKTSEEIGILNKCMTDVNENIRKNQIKYNFAKVQMDFIKNLIQVNIKDYQNRCSGTIDFTLIITNLILSYIVELENIKTLQNVLKFSQELISKMCLMSQDQAIRFHKMYTSIKGGRFDVDLAFKKVGLFDLNDTVVRRTSMIPRTSEESPFRQNLLETAPIAESGPGSFEYDGNVFSNLLDG